MKCVFYCSARLTLTWPQHVRNVRVMLSVVSLNAVNDGSASVSLFNPRGFVNAGAQAVITPRTATSLAYGAVGSGVVQTGSTAQTKKTGGN